MPARIRKPRDNARVEAQTELDGALFLRQHSHMPKVLRSQKRERDLFQGTLDMFVLKSLVWGARHGYEILRWIVQVTGGDLNIEEGALYPALHRIEARGWVSSEWGIAESGRQARFYRLNDAGRQELELETATWRRYVAAAAKILEAV